MHLCAVSRGTLGIFNAGQLLAAVSTSETERYSFVAYKTDCCLCLCHAGSVGRCVLCLCDLEFGFSHDETLTARAVTSLFLDKRL